MSVCIEYLNVKHNEQDDYFQQLTDREGLVRSTNNACEETQKPLRFKFNTLSFWMARSRQRKRLASLDERMLKDIGYSAEQASSEYKKPFWKSSLIQ